jgi:hypothetical protein
VNEVDAERDRSRPAAEKGKEEEKVHGFEFARNGWAG